MDQQAANRAVTARLNEMFRDMLAANVQAEERAAKADPIKHKLTLVFPSGSKKNWRYIATIRTRGRTTRYCWSVHRNVAGYFLGWREVWTGKTGRRDQWRASKRKKTLEAWARKRTRAHQARLQKAA